MFRHGETPHDHHPHPHRHRHGAVDPAIATTARGMWALKWSFQFPCDGASANGGRLAPVVWRCWQTRSIMWPMPAPLPLWVALARRPRQQALHCWL